jgi:hypothetical protein
LRWCAKVEVVVSDGSPSYRAAIERHLGHATHVVDRFHVVRWFASGLIEVRRRVQRTGEPGESPVFSPAIFRTRYLQLARADELDSDRFARLVHALMQDPELWHAWRLLQQLYGIYDAGDEAEAAARVESFVYAWEAAPIPEFRSVLKALVQVAARDPGLSPLRTHHQRAPRGDQQQARCAQAHRLRLRQRRQLRREGFVVVSTGGIMSEPSWWGSSHEIAGNPPFKRVLPARGSTQRPRPISSSTVALNRRASIRRWNVRDRSLPEGSR